jgi:hypothetical protein
MRLTKAGFSFRNRFPCNFSELHEVEERQGGGATTNRL